MSLNEAYWTNEIIELLVRKLSVTITVHTSHDLNEF